MTSLDFSKALSVLKCLILLINRELNIRTLYRMLLFITTVKTPFLNSLLISLCRKSIKRVSYIRTDISVNRSCFISISTEVKWFSVTGFSVIKLVTECFRGRPRLRFSLTGLIDSWETFKVSEGAFNSFKSTL